MANSTGKQSWKSAYVIVGIGLAVVAALTFANRHGGLESIELSASDRRIYRPAAYHPPSGAVVVARVDDKSITELGRWPWGRDVQAQLVRALTDDQAAVVGFDVMLPERDSADLQREQISQELKGQGDAAVRAMLAQSND